jgi:uncharacterized protein
LYLLGGLGPPVSALVCQRAFDGKAAPSEFWRRLLDVRRVGIWWALFVLVAPLLLNAVAILSCSAWHGALTGFVPREPDATLSAIGVLSLLAKKLVLGPVPEEIGWRGFAIDRLVPAKGLLASSVLVWVAWTLWHVPLYFIAGTTQHQVGVWSISFLLFAVGLLPESVLFAWIYIRTGRSILAAILFHFAINVAGDVLLRLTPEAEALRICWIALVAVVILGRTQKAETAMST